MLYKDNFATRFIKGLYSTVIGNLIVIITGIFSIAIAARYLEPGQLGIYVLIETTSTLLVTIFELGLGISIAKSIPEIQNTNEIKAKHISTILCFRLIIVIIIIIIGISAKIFFKGIVNINFFVTYFYWVIIYFSFMGIENQLSYILQGLNYYGRLARARILSSVIRLLLVAILLVFLRAQLSGLLYANIIPIGISCVYQYSGLPKWAKRIYINMNILLKYISFGSPIWINSLITVFFNRIDIFIIGIFSGARGIALYSIAIKIPESLLKLFQAFESVYLPHMSELISEKKIFKASFLMNQSIRYMGVLSIIGTMIAILFGRNIIHVLFSDKYIHSAPVFAILMFAICFEIITNIFGYALVAAGKSDKPLKANILSIITNLVGNIIFIKPFGLIGAATTRVVSRLISWPVYMGYLKTISLKLKIKYFSRLIVLTIIFWIIIFSLNPVSLIIKFGLIFLFILLTILLIEFKMSEIKLVFSLFKKQNA